MAKKKKIKTTPQQMEILRQKQRMFSERRLQKDREIKKKRQSIRNIDDEGVEKNVEILNKNVEYVNNDLLPKIYGEDIEPKDFLNAKKVERIKRNHNIPIEIREKVYHLIKTQPLKRKKCHQNATQIALSIDGVQKVNGWYSEPFMNVMNGVFEKYTFTYDSANDLASIVNKKTFQFLNLTKISMGLFVVVDDDKDSIWDFINDEIYMRHSWNSYKGIHFDLPKNLGYPNTDWMEYYMHSVDNLRDMNMDTEITQSFLNMTLLTPTKDDVLNSNYVGKLMFNGSKRLVEAFQSTDGIWGMEIN